MISPSKLVNKSTCRIVCDEGASIGTGFFFTFTNPSKPSEYAPFLVTNKHVIQGASIVDIRFNVTNESQPNIKFYDIRLDNAESQFIMHPEKDVDLCVLPLNPLFNKFESENFKPDIFLFADSNLRGANRLTPIEEVYMTGYPNGLWDEVNNKPVTRKGITASDVNLNWNGKSEFMIDMACFGGSSGSPVFLMNEGSFVVDEGIAMGMRFILLGILHSGPVVNLKGDIEIINVPTSSKAIVLSQTTMNLGIAVKAEKLNDFKEVLGF